MDKLTLIFGVLKGLGAVLKNLFLGLFISNAAVNKEVAKQKKKEVKDAKKAGKRKNNISNLDDDDLDSGLQSSGE